MQYNIMQYKTIHNTIQYTIQYKTQYNSLTVGKVLVNWDLSIGGRIV